MTTAQTVTAAVCCQTLRGEEGKKEQGYSQRNFSEKDTSLIPPSHISPVKKKKYAITAPTWLHLQTSHCAPFFFADWTPTTYYFIEEGRFNFCGHHRGVNKTRCTGASVPHTPFQDAACQRAPADGSFLTAVTRNRL